MTIANKVNRVKTLTVWCDRKKMRAIPIHISIDIGVGVVSTRPNPPAPREAEVRVERFSKKNVKWMSEHMNSDYEILIFIAPENVSVKLEKARIHQLDVDTGYVEFRSQKYMWITEDGDYVEPEKVIFT